MSKNYLPLLFLLFVAQDISACGYAWVSDCSSQVHLRINGSLDSFNIAACPSGYDFDGIQLGNIQSLALANTKTITWESCQNNVSGVQLRYRVYEQNIPGGNWLSLNLLEYNQVIDGPYTTRYRGNPVDISLTNGLTVGKTYTIEVYLIAEVDTIGDDYIPETTFFRNNNGSNYKLNFTYGGTAAPPLALLSHLTRPSCNGSTDGKISVSVYGNLTGIFYHWSNTNINFFQQNNLAAGSYGITVTNILGQSSAQTITLEQPSPLQSTFTNVQSVGCNNSPGTATVMASGGTPPYQFQWQNGQQTATATFPSSGSWLVTIKDAHNCTATGSVLISNNGLVERTITADICSGSTYFFGGQAYSTAGTYSFTMPGSTGCDTLTHLIINVINPAELLAPLPDAVTLSCSAPQINLCALTHPAAVFQWEKDGIPATNTPCLLATAGGTYVLQVVLAGCEATKIILATEHLTADPAQVTGNFIANCNGIQPGWLTAQTNAESPSYSWVYDGQVVSTDNALFFQITEFQNGFPVLPTLSITDVFGCTNAMPVFNVVYTQNTLFPVLDVNAVDASSSTSSDGSAEVSIIGGISPFAVDWSNGATTPVITNLAPGNYCVTVVGSNGCSATNCVTVGFALATTTNEVQPLRISPNPVSAGDFIEIAIPVDIGGESLQMEIITITGKMIKIETVHPKNAPSMPVQIPVGFYPGMVTIRLTGGEHAYVGKIMVQ